MMRTLLIALAVLTLAWGCDREDAWDLVQTAGPVETQHRPLMPIERIRLLDWVDLELVPDTHEWLTITGPRNIIADVTTHTHNGWLIIRDHNDFKWVRGYDHRVTVRVGVRRLQEIFFQGPGNITSLDTLVTDSLTFRGENISGNVNLTIWAGYFVCNLKWSYADVTIAGHAADAYLNLRGTGFLRCGDLLIQRAWWVHNVSGGDIIVNVAQVLNGIIEGPGDIVYTFTGPPEAKSLEYRHRGTGQFIEVEPVVR